MGAALGSAGKLGLLDLFKLNHAIFGGVNSVVFDGVGAWAGYLGAASLADENFTFFDFLATKALNA